MEVSETRRLRQMEEENGRLKQVSFTETHHPIA
jgi:hypothetical protein